MQNQKPTNKLSPEYLALLDRKLRYVERQIRRLSYAVAELQADSLVYNGDEVEQIEEAT